MQGFVFAAHSGSPAPRAPMRASPGSAVAEAAWQRTAFSWLQGIHSTKIYALHPGKCSKAGSMNPNHNSRRRAGSADGQVGDIKGSKQAER